MIHVHGDIRKKGGLKMSKKNYTNYSKQYCNDDKIIERIVTDYISGMTDRYAISVFDELLRC